MITVYVAGYPKSGTTWLTRLLGDALCCKTGGSVPSEDLKEVAAETFGDNLDIIIRKGHFRLHDELSKVPVPKKHTMYWKALKENEHKVVFIVRDPRDIVVSGAHYWGTPTRKFLHHLLRGENGLRFVGSWKEYMLEWLSRYKNFNAILVRYEDLLVGYIELTKVLSALKIDVPDNKVRKAYERQNFRNRHHDIMLNGERYNLGRSQNLKLLRKGVSGDWRTHFEIKDAELLEKHLGKLLQLLNYTRNSSWIQEWK